MIHLKWKHRKTTFFEGTKLPCFTWLWSMEHLSIHWFKSKKWRGHKWWGWLPKGDLTTDFCGHNQRIKLIFGTNRNTGLHSKIVLIIIHRWGFVPHWACLFHLHHFLFRGCVITTANCFFLILCMCPVLYLQPDKSCNLYTYVVWFYVMLKGNGLDLIKNPVWSCLIEEGRQPNSGSPGCLEVTNRRTQTW